MFDEKVIEVQILNPGYEDHASDVWLINTEYKEVVVRTSRMMEEPNNDFGGDAKTSLVLIQGMFLNLKTLTTH